MGEIFISYRRADSQDVVGRIIDRLAPYYGEDRIFRDVHSLHGGEEFETEINRALNDCKVGVVVMGSHWEGAPGENRLENPGDLVRLEVEALLKRGIPVVPVFVRGRRSIRAEDLPEGLKPLARRHALTVRPDPDFDGDVLRLKKTLDPYLTGLNRRRRVARIGLAIGVAAALGLAIYISTLSSLDDRGEIDLATASVGETDYTSFAAKKQLCEQKVVAGHFAPPLRSSTIEKEKFFQTLSTTSVEVKDKKSRDGIGYFLDYWNSKPEIKDTRWLAYIMATAYFETRGTFEPIRETFAGSDEEAIAKLDKAYVDKGRKGHYYWYRVPETGRSYFGRGYVQLTWADNYKKIDKLFGISSPHKSYYWNPELALEQDHAAKILVTSMIYGIYRRHQCLAAYFDKEKGISDWKGARSIINGDVAKNGGRVADIAQAFHRAIVVSSR